MTAEYLQESLVDIMKGLFSGKRYKSPKGGLVPINVYAQNPPRGKVNVLDENDDDEEEEFDPFPYIIVRISDGDNDRDGSVVNMIFIIGIWDDDLNQQGYRDVIHAIESIRQRIMANPIIDGIAYPKGQFHWMVQEDDYYPYSLGACSQQFVVASINVEDDFI